MVTKCVVPNCGNSCNTKLSVTLFSFPKDPQLAQTWLQATRARGVKQIKSHHKVCSKHFEKHLILDNFGATRLEPGSVPTIFEWNRKPTVENESSPLVNCSNPFLTLEDVSELPLNSYHRLILPKPAPGQPIPKVKIPSLVKRVAVLSSENKRTLGCDVILPDEHVAVSEILPRVRMSPVRGLSCRGYERIASKISSLHVSDDDSNGPVHVGHHIEEYDNSDCPLIEVDVPLPSEIDDPLSTGSDVLLDRSEPLAGEVIIEECSMIEDEIMQSHQVHEPIVTLTEKDYDSDNPINNNIDVTAHGSQTTSPEETSRLKQDDVTNLLTPTEKAPETVPTSQNMLQDPCDITVSPIKNLPKNIVVLQFDSKTGSCAENPDLNELSAQDIACIRKSLSSSQASRVVILKKSGQTKSKVEKIPPPIESSNYHPSKMQPILPKVQKPSSSSESVKTAMSSCVEIKPKPPGQTPSEGTNTHSQQKVTVSSSPASSLVTLSKNNALTKLNASGSPAYFIPQGSSLTSSLASTLVLQSSQNKSKSAKNCVPVTQSVANFLIATPTSSTFVSSHNATSQQAVPPVVYQISNMVPVNSSLTQKPQMPPQNNNVKIVAPQMTYLIPIGSTISQPVEPNNTSSNGAGKLMAEKKSTSLCPATKAKKRRKFTKDEDDAPASSTRTDSGPNSEVEQRLLKQVDSLKTALRRKTSTIKELKKDKNRLTKKLKLLGMALGKMRKASMLNLATSRFLEGADERVLSIMKLELKDLGGEGKLGDVVSTIHYLSKILNDQVKSQLRPYVKQIDTEIGEVVTKVEPPW